MNISQKIASSLVLSFGLALPALAQDTATPTETPSLSTVVATVDGVEITLGHIAAAKETLPDQYRSLPANVLFPGILDQLIQQQALADSFLGETPDHIVLALDNENRSLLAAEVIENVMADAVTQELLDDLYNKTYSEAGLGEEYKASHILVETEEEANAIKAEVDAGADFAATAREKSTGPSGPRGGDLGWFGTGVMVPSFEAAVVELKPGQVSDPVQTQFGWHVIKLMDSRLKEAPSMEDVREELEMQIRQDAVTAKIEELTSKANVDRSMASDLDPNILDQVQLLPQK